VKEFQRKCFEKVNDKQVEFGPNQLDTGGCYITPSGCRDAVADLEF